jgi:hypothetical protein
MGCEDGELQGPKAQDLEAPQPRRPFRLDGLAHGVEEEIRVATVGRVTSWALVRRKYSRRPTITRRPGVVIYRLKLSRYGNRSKSPLRVATIV